MAKSKAPAAKAAAKDNGKAHRHPAMPTHRPAQGKTKRLPTAGRDPRHGFAGPGTGPPNPRYR